MSRFRPMQGESGKKGNEVWTIWKSKKIAWHWIAMYRSNSYQATIPRPIITWWWRNRYYELVWHK